MKAAIIGAALVGSLVAGAHALILNPGTPDAAINLGGRVYQLEYWRCIGAFDAVTFEDGSVDCKPGAHERAYEGWKIAQERALRPAGLTFVGHIDAEFDK